MFYMPVWFVRDRLKALWTMNASFRLNKSLYRQMNTSYWYVLPYNISLVYNIPISMDRLLAAWLKSLGF